jgi:hypothetical protein
VVVIDFFFFSISLLLSKIQKFHFICFLYSLVIVFCYVSIIFCIFFFLILSLIIWFHLFLYIISVPVLFISIYLLPFSLLNFIFNIIPQHLILTCFDVKFSSFFIAICFVLGQF